MPTYSFGEDSPLKFHISDDLARHYNAAVEEFLKAQMRFKQKFGRQWDPAKDPIAIRWDRSQKRAWNEFAKIMKKTIDERGPVYPNELLEDFLVKNGSESVSKLASHAGRAITFGVALGVAWTFLSAYAHKHIEVEV